MTTLAERVLTMPKVEAGLRVLAYVHLRNIYDSTGAGRVARQMTEHLARRGDVDLRVLADAGDMKRVLPLVGGDWAGYEYCTFAADTSRQQARWFWLGGPGAETFWDEAQVVYCTAESYVPVKRARLAVTVHDAAYFETTAHRQDRAFWMQKMKWTLLFRKLAKKADMIHTVSHFSADRLAHFFPEMRTRLRVVHNAVTPQFFAPETVAGREFLEAAGLNGREFVLIPGGLHFRKNAELILEAVPKLMRLRPEVAVVVVNHSNPVYVERAKAMGLGMLGFVSDDALRALYGAASVVWFPSRYEGFGLPVIEAMACGAPVVASDASSLPEIAGSAAVLVAPGEAMAHVDAIEGLLTDARARAEMSAAGRERAKRFTWDASAEQMKRNFDALL